MVAQVVAAALVVSSLAGAQNAGAASKPQAQQSGFRIVVTPSAAGAGTARDGRLLLVISTDSSSEPRHRDVGRR